MNKSINIPRLHRLLLRIFGYKTFREVCAREWIISPASVSTAPPAICLLGETEKVTGVGPGTNVLHEQLRVKGGRRDHAATKARILRNAYLLGDYIYKRAAKIQIGVSSERWLCQSFGGEIKDIASLACSEVDSKYFGHWVTDGIPLLMAALEVAPPIRNSDPMTLHQQQYLSMLGLNYESFKGGRIRELIILEDFGQNKYKRVRYERIRKSLCRLGGHPPSHAGAIILRGMSGASRSLINEQEIADYLLSIGFKVIDPQLQSANEIVAAIKGALVVVGVEGSHLAHGLFAMNPRGTLLVLQPPYRFNNVHKDYTDCMDLKYAFVVGEVCNGGFRMPIDHFKKTLDLIAAHQSPI